MQAEPYTGPVRLGEETEAVLAQCGSEERLLTRVARRTERPAPEPPLLLVSEHAAAAAKGPERKIAADAKPGQERGGGGGAAAVGAPGWGRPRP